MALVAFNGRDILNASGGNKGKINFIFHFDLVKLFKFVVHKTHRKGEKGTQFAVLWYIAL